MKIILNLSKDGQRILSALALLFEYPNISKLLQELIEFEIKTSYSQTAHETLEEVSEKVHLFS